MTIVARQLFIAVIVAALLACVLGDLPPVVVTCSYMELKNEESPDYEVTSYFENEVNVFNYADEDDVAEPFIAPLFLTAKFIVQNKGEKELSFIYSSTIVNSTETEDSVPEFEFKPENGETSIAPGQNVTFIFKYPSEYEGEVKFEGVLTAFMVFKTDSVSYEPISFKATTEVLVPGCQEECNDEGEGKGECIDIIGHCKCVEPWTGVTCKSAFHLHTRSICPGQSLNFTYAFVSTSCTGYWCIYDEDSDDTTYMSGSLYGEYCTKGAPVELTDVSVIAYLVPGNYRFVYWRKFGESEDGEVGFTVKDWEDCGGGYDCSIDTEHPCSGSGKCDDVTGECTCKDSHFWQDCSRGCGLLTRLTARSGIIDSDSGGENENENPLYIQNTDCTWIIEPEGKGVDKIHIEFSRFNFASPTDTLMVRSVGRSGEVDKDSVLLGKYGGSSLPQSTDYKGSKIALIFTTSYVGSSRGFRLTYSVVTDPISGGVIAAIVVSGAIVATAVIILTVWLLRRRSRILDEALAFAKVATSEPWTLGDGEEEIIRSDRAIGSDGVMPEHSELEKILGWMDMQDIEFECSDYDLRFGLEDRMPCPVMVEQKQVITITNSSDVPLAFCFFHPVENYTMQCSLVPGKGTLAPGTGIRVQVTLKLMYTTRLDLSIKCAVWQGARGPGDFYAFATSDGLCAPGPNDKPSEDEGVDPNHVFREALAKSKPLKTARLIVHLEGAVSERIDPGEVVLNPEPLGEGAYGVVYSGRYRGRFVAVKVMSRQHDLLEQITKDFEKEIDLYRRLHNPLIVEFVGASLIPGKLCMCTELIQRGSLEQLMSESEIPLALQVRFAMNIAEAVAFLHSSNVMHRDLKPSNIMVVSTSLNSKVNCKIGDFGTARNVKDVTEFYTYTQGQGTPIYMAPEMLAVKPYNCKADVYSFAITIWQMAAREKPWLNVPVWDIPTRVIHGKRPQMPGGIPKDYAEVIRKCWAPKPDDRPAFSDVVDMLVPIAKHTKKESRKEGNKDSKKHSHTGGVSESTVDFSMSLDESVRNRTSNNNTTETTQSTADEQPKSKKHEHSKKKKKKQH